MSEYLTPRGMPYNRKEMIRAGYKLSGASRPCKACGAAIEWWKTTNGKSMPFNAAADNEVQAVTHWATCPAANNFRADKTPPAPTAAPSPAAAPRQLTPAARTRLEEELCRMVDRTGARAIIVLDEDGDTFAYRFGLNAEDMRMDVITAANKLRAAINSQGDRA